MEPHEALSSAAEIAVALAGFAGVVVAFRSSTLHEWSPLDKYRLWLLLGNALVPIRLFVRHALACDQTNASFHLALVQRLFPRVDSYFSLLSRRHQSQLGPNAIRKMGSYRYLFYTIAIVGTLVGLMQIYNVVISAVFWLFYVAIVFQLATGTLQFARMILLPPHTTHD
jgi:hypothetical protein